ncbi:hypothetical protein [Streptobacillus moniliformis]|uniref:Uncharacterized protein n=1 Tax=Streptobacillus moniliformis (strain ATCC 14647 / DSM 12112 / NCTC 10651 / 9901) TaxID=519441 RepID=D1AYF8_STRM9|nr:hypothetical protein [Streptobacillus moniliformis]ACZ01334.1 hypothetical protein Smon_0867 [Streptobacillus moniliformis DSM 12112]AVL43647.1 hypothetical protein CEP89_07510 [Streptobacillus moniliformis]SQA13507.1 Uncharacterised protein [Streptobacillus moniliformis]
MESKIISKFCGMINGIEFNDENLYRSVEFLLEQIEYKFGEVYNNEFVDELKSTIYSMYFKYDDFDYFDLENKFYYCIQKFDKFNEIQFEYFGSDCEIEKLNENLLNGKYYNRNIHSMFNIE